MKMYPKNYIMEELRKKVEAYKNDNSIKYLLLLMYETTL
jgi:hypothetical protein